MKKPQTPEPEFNQEAENKALQRDLDNYGVSIGEWVGDNLVRLDPKFLFLCPATRTYFYSVGGDLNEIKPTSRRWELRVEGSVATRDDVVHVVAHGSAKVVV